MDNLGKNRQELYELWIIWVKIGSSLYLYSILIVAIDPLSEKNGCQTPASKAWWKTRVWVPGMGMEGDYRQN